MVLDIQQNEAEVQIGTDKNHKHVLVWKNIIGLLYLHVAGIMGIIHMLSTCKLLNFISFFILALCCSIGISVGSHKLWSHQAFKAKLPLQIVLAIFQTMTFQNHIYEWVRDHKAHHKYSDTDADPHNASRGFFYSHMGWLMVKKHKLVTENGRNIDLSNLKTDPLVMFQKKYYLILMPFFTFILPTLYFHYISGETLINAWNLSVGVWVIQAHGTWSINSAAHLWGKRPYDKNIKPVENILADILTGGEGGHNYHHTFPQDYKSSKVLFAYPLSSKFIEMMAAIGLTYDLKTSSPEIIIKRIQRTGDVTQINKEIREQIEKCN